MAHTLVSSLLKRLQEQDIHTSTIGKVKGSLNRTVIGLLHNTNVEAGEIFLLCICHCLLLVLETNQFIEMKMRKNLMTVELRKLTYKNQQDG